MPIDFRPKKILAKAREVLDKPAVREVSMVCTRALAVAAHLGQAQLKGPLAGLGLAAGVVNIVMGTEERDTYDTIKGVATAAGLTQCPTFFNGIFDALADDGFFADGDVLVSANNHSLRCVTSPDGIRVAAVFDAFGRATNYAGWIQAGDTGASQKVLLEKYFARVNSDVITLKGVTSRYDGGLQLKIMPIGGYEKLFCAGDRDPQVFAENFKRARALNISQAFCLTGPPGSGKTSFCYLVGRALGGRTLVLDPSLFSDSSGDFVASLLTSVRLFSPAVVLFDDVDNIGNGSAGGKLLTLLDVMRRENPDILVMSATNYPDRILPSLRRPGRLGRRLDFGAPGLSARIAIIRAYAKALGLPKDALFRLEMMSPQMEHPLFTPDYIKDMCEHALVLTERELKSYMGEVLSFLRDLNGERVVTYTDKGSDEDEEGSDEDEEGES